MENRFPRFQVKLRVTGNNDFQHQDGLSVVTLKRSVCGGSRKKYLEKRRQAHEVLKAPV